MPYVATLCTNSAYQDICALRQRKVDADAVADALCELIFSPEKKS